MAAKTYGEAQVLSYVNGLTAPVNFLLISAAIYFVIVMPMNNLIEFRDKKLHFGHSWSRKRSPRTSNS
ncbi:hypothetical protein GCM10023081_08740 [Arthrobacter ginkgonis]|uniref:Uncharacterized protein n=1 Tax=Arthrobacter ginkgonis TaxID=1630594 RepID=A0ABP7BZN1_9MICC